jgi:hypothetical protein
MKVEGTNAGKSEVLPMFTLTGIRRGEPDPALFYPPPGYRIIKGY